MVVKSVGDPVRVWVGVKNKSSTTLVFGVDALYNSTKIGTYNYEIAPDQTREVPFNFAAPSVGTYDITGQVRLRDSDQVLDSKVLPGELVVQEGVVCPPPHQTFSVPGVTLDMVLTDCDRTWDTGTQTFYPNEQIHARFGAWGINQGDVIRWEIGWIDAQGGEQMWPESTSNWTVPEQLEYVGAMAWWPEPAGSYTWSVWCPFIVKIFVNNQLLAKLYFRVISG